MEAGMVYPTAPFDTQAQHPNVDVPPAHTGAGENVESPGKTMGMLSKVKNKAKKFRNRMKKVTGSNRAATDHGDNVNEHGTRDFSGMPGPHDKNFDDDAVESEEDDEEEQDHKSNKKEFKYEQLRSIGALDNQGDGSEVEVHGGVPVPAMADDTGSYWKRADDSDPISAYKSAGPPGALQASPTEYRNYAADDEIAPGGGVSTDGRKREVGAPLEERGRSGENLSATSGPEFKPDIDASNRSYDEPVEPPFKHGVSNVSVSDTHVSYPGSLASSNLSADESSDPAYDKIGVMEEDLSADRKLGVGHPYDQHAGSGKGNVLETSVPEFEPEGKRSNLFDSESGDSQSKYGVLGTGGTSASDIDVPYPGDLVKPNPSFGRSSSPTHGKIAVVNNDALPDEKLGLGLPTGEHSGSGSRNLLETSVPEGEELSGYEKGGSSLPLEADELVYRPVSDPEEGSSLTSPPGKLEGDVYERNTDLQESRTGSPFQLSEKDRPTSEVDTISLKAEDDIPANYGEQKRSFDVASEQPAGEGIDTAGDGSHENWGKWSADKISAAKDVTVSSLVASDLRNDGEYQDNSGNKSVDAIGATDKIPDKVLESKNVDAAKLPAGEDVHQDSEEEYYDPNEVKDNQFEQGFALGNAEDDALSGTLAGSAIETLQGLKGTVQSSLGYSNQDNRDAGGEDRPGPVEGEERAFSPSSSQQQQKGGFVQGLRQSVASSLGYGKTGPEEEVGQDTHVLEGGVEPETDFDSRQQQSGGTEQVEEKARSPSSSQLLSPGSSQQQQKGGFVQGLRQSVASSLGYGKTGPEEEVGQDTDVLERGVEPEADFDRRQQQSGGTEQVEEKARSPSNSQLLSPSSSQQQQKGGFVQGLGQSVASSLGYGKAVPEEEAGQDTDVLERGVEPGADFDSRQQQSGGIEQVEEKARSPSSSQLLSPSSSQQQQKGGFVQGLGQSVASSLGYGKTVPEEEAGQDTDLLERGVEPETDFDSRQQQPGGTEEVEEKARSPSSSQLLSPGSSQQQQKGGFVQGLKQTVASSIGYGKAGPDEEVAHNTDALERGRESETDLDSRQQQPDGVEGVRERALSPSSSQEQQKGGFVQGLKETATSPLGYGEAGSDETGHNNDVLEKGGASETDVDSRQQQPAGTYQALKNVFASTLGYGAGSGEQSPTMTKEIESELPAEPERREIPHDEGETHESVAKPELVLSDVKDNAGRVDEVPEPSPRSRGVLQGWKDRVTSSLGYNSQPEETHRDAPHTEPVPVPSPGADHPPSGYAQKLMDTTAAARNYFGYGSSNEDKVERNIDDGHDGEKFTNPSHVDDASKPSPRE